MNLFFIAMVGINLVMPGGAPTRSPTIVETLITSVVVFGPYSTVGGVVTAIYYSDQVHRQKLKESLFKYKQQNNTAIQSALRLGGGVAVRDMGKIMELNTKQTQVLGKHLRANRKRLAKMTDEQFARAMSQHAIEIKSNL